LASRASPSSAVSPSSTAAAWRIREESRSPQHVTESSDRLVSSPRRKTPWTRSRRSPNISSTPDTASARFAAPTRESIKRRCRFLIRSRVESAPCSSPPFAICAAPISSFVTPEHAETTTSGARSRAVRMIWRTLRMAEASSTEVPPNFMTIMTRFSPPSLKQVDHAPEGQEEEGDDAAEQERKGSPAHQDEDQEYPEESDAPGAVAQIVRQKRRDHVRAVKRGYRNHIEHAEHDVEHDPSVEHLQEVPQPVGKERARIRQKRNQLGENDEQDRAEKRERVVRHRAHDRDEDVVAPHVPKIERVDRHRLGPRDEDAPRRQEREERHEDGADRVDVRDRVERQTAEIARGRIAETERHPAVRDFVDHDREQKYGQYIELLHHPGGCAKGICRRGSRRLRLRLWRSGARSSTGGASRNRS